LAAAAIAVLLMLLHPPFFYEGRGGGLSYHWLFESTGARVDVSLLFAQWAAVGIISAILYYLSKD
jgi:hypothetical protein